MLAYVITLIFRRCAALKLPLTKLENLNRPTSGFIDTLAKSLFGLLWFLWEYFSDSTTSKTTFFRRWIQGFVEELSLLRWWRLPLRNRHKVLLQHMKPPTTRNPTFRNLSFPSIRKNSAKFPIQKSLSISIIEWYITFISFTSYWCWFGRTWPFCSSNIHSIQSTS